VWTTFRNKPAVPIRTQALGKNGTSAGGTDTLRAELGCEADANESTASDDAWLQVAQAKLCLQREMVELTEKALRGNCGNCHDACRRRLEDVEDGEETDRGCDQDDAAIILGRPCWVGYRSTMPTDDGRRDAAARAFQASARMRLTETELKITIAAHRRHIEANLGKIMSRIRRGAFCYPGSSLRVRLAVDGQQPLTG